MDLRDNGIRVGNFTALRQDDGTYIYKAEPFVRPRVKASYKEKPQHKLIETYESASKERFKKDISSLTLKIANFLKQI